MKRYIIVSLSLALLLVLSACGGTENTDNDFDPNKPVNSDQPMPVEPDGGIGDGQGLDGDKMPATAWVENAELVIMESYPVQVSLNVSGEMPTPCHEFRFEISQPDAENQIFVEVFSVVNPEEVCIEVIEPFSENISLPVNTLADGVYKVFVNDELVGEFSYPA